MQFNMRPQLSYLSSGRWPEYSNRENKFSDYTPIDPDIKAYDFRFPYEPNKYKEFRAYNQYKENEMNNKINELIGQEEDVYSNMNFNFKSIISSSGIEFLSKKIGLEYNKENMIKLNEYYATNSFMDDRTNILKDMGVRNYFVDMETLGKPVNENSSVNCNEKMKFIHLKNNPILILTGR